MKDLRNFIQLIEQGQYAYEDMHNQYDGVWDTFKKISNLSVPDAVMAPSPEMLRLEHRRYRAISANQKTRFDKDQGPVDDDALLTPNVSDGNGGPSPNGDGTKSGSGASPNHPQ